MTIKYILCLLYMFMICFIPILLFFLCFSIAPNLRWNIPKCHQLGEEIWINDWSIFFLNSRQNVYICPVSPSLSFSPSLTLLRRLIVKCSVSAGRHCQASSPITCKYYNKNNDDNNWSSGGKTLLSQEPNVLVLFREPPLSTGVFVNDASLLSLAAEFFGDEGWNCHTAKLCVYVCVTACES